MTIHLAGGKSASSGLAVVSDIVTGYRKGANATASSYPMMLLSYRGGYLFAIDSSAPELALKLWVESARAAHSPQVPRSPWPMVVAMLR